MAVSIKYVRSVARQTAQGRGPEERAVHRESRRARLLGVHQAQIAVE